MRQIQHVPVHVEPRDVGRLFPVGHRRAEVALQDIGHVHIADARKSSRALPCPDQRAQPNLLHQPLHALVFDGFCH